MIFTQLFQARSDGRGGRRIFALALSGAMIVAASTLAYADTAKPVVSESFAPKSFADVVDRVAPAVVNIQVTSRAKPAMTMMNGVPGNMREFFQYHYGPGQNGRGEQPSRTGAGSGFVVDPDGYIVTNEHVIRGADQVTVTFKDGKTAAARLVGQDDKTDLALLKVDSETPLPHVRFGASDDVRVGDWIVTVGNPFGLGHSVNVGIVSASGRTIGAGPYDDFLQIDAAINRGNSGGPAFDVHGNVIGVNAAIYSPNGGNVGIGFAIPSAIAERVIADLKSKGIVERGWLGVSIQPMNDDIADSLGLVGQGGALISDIKRGGPADKAGVRVGDVILSVDDAPIESVRDLPRFIANIDPGTRSRLAVLRNGSNIDISVRVGLQPGSDNVASLVNANVPDADVGLSLRALDEVTARQLGLSANTTGVVVTAVEPASPAAEKGLRPGDVLIRADGKLLTSPSEWRALVAEARKAGKKAVLALIRRNDGQRFVAIPVGAA